MEGGDALLPFVSQFDGSLSTNLWEDDEGVVHDPTRRRRGTG